MKTSIINRKYLYTSLGVFAIFVVWLILGIIIDNPIVLPSISNVFKTLGDLLSSGLTYKIILFTLIRVLISLILGILLGVILGVVSAISDRIYYFLSPIIKIMRVLPIASIILIVLIMFGSHGINDITFSPIIVALLMIIPIIYEAIYRGIKNINQDLLNAAKLDYCSKWTMIKSIYLPLIKNELEISIFQSIGLSLKVMVMAEYISQTQTSIGKVLLDAKTFLQYDHVFAWTIILIVLCFVIEGIINLIKSKNIT